MFKKKSGITLVALVITMIILLVLAGVSINFILGSEGIFTKAQTAVDKYKKAQQYEQEMLNEVENYITDGYLVAGRGEEKTTMKKFGNKDVPIPGGFYYVGGDLDTGIVISDNSLDANKGDSFEVAQTLVGNQFVWIPCNVTDDANNEYKKSDEWNSYKNPSGFTPTDVEGEIPARIANEKIAVAKYGGFYVARYEAGLSPTISRYESGTQPSNSEIYNKYGIPVSKSKQVPWNFVDYYHAFASSIQMYSNNKSVESWLISGTQWDVMLKVMESKGKVAGTNNSPSLTDSGTWGNFKNQTLTYTGRVAAFNSGTLSAFPENETQGGTKASGMYLLTTGSSETAKVYNIFDVAGNLWEWTAEKNSSNGKAVFRGGAHDGNSGQNPACYRYSDAPTYMDYSIGFRVVLYIE